MEAPGALHAASNAALVSAEYVRLVRRTAYLGVSESLSIVSTIMVVDTMVLAHASINKVTWLGAYIGVSLVDVNAPGQFWTMEAKISKGCDVVPF